MIDADKARFSALMTGLSEYYRQPLSEFAMQIYWQALERFDFMAVNDAANRHAQNPDTGQFLPKASDLIRMMEGSTKDGAAIAWSKFDEAFRHIGTYEDIRFDDPIIMRVVHDMGGWVSFGDKMEDEWPFIANDFKARYSAYKARGSSFDFPSILRGRANGHNQSHGYALSPPINFGAPSGCLMVEKSGSDSVGGGDLKRALGILKTHLSVVPKLIAND